VFFTADQAVKLGRAAFRMQGHSNTHAASSGLFHHVNELLAQQLQMVNTSMVVQTRLLRCYKSFTNFASGVWSQVEKVMAQRFFGNNSSVSRARDVLEKQ